jgi:hypothetical protein
MRRGTPRLQVRRLALVSLLLAVAALGVSASALAAPGDPTLNGCVGDLSGCTTVSPTGVVGGSGPLAVQGTNLYSIGYYTALSHYTLAASGTPTFVGCTGFQSGCTATNPPGALGSLTAIAVSGNNLYTSTQNGADLSHFRLDSAGNPTFVGCLGSLSGCTSTSPATALHDARAMLISGQHLYVASDDALSELTLDASGNPTLVSCIGDLSGCTAPNPSGAVDSGEGIAISGQNMYLASYGNGDVSHLTLDGSGSPAFESCVGELSGCTATNPVTALDRVNGLALDGADLYATSQTGAGLTHLTIGSSGQLTFAGCLGSLSGCTSISPATALDSTGGVAVGKTGGVRYLYVSGSNDFSHVTLDASGNPTFNGCLGSTTGCTPTTPTSALSTGSGIAISGSHVYVNGGGFTGYLSYLTFELAPPPPPPPPPATPSLTGLSVYPHESSIAGRKIHGRCVKATKTNKAHKSCHRSIKLKISYSLNVAATITFTVQAMSSGRKVKGKCVKQTPKNVKHHAKCTLTKKISGSLTTGGTAGANAFTFNGKIAGHQLAAGGYVLTATPTGGKPQTAKFTISA